MKTEETTTPSIQKAVPSNRQENHWKEYCSQKPPKTT